MALHCDNPRFGAHYDCELREVLDTNDVHVSLKLC